MRNSILSAALIGSAIMGGILGGCINQIQRDNEAIDSWHGVLVVRDGTAVANPSALTPHELAGVQIIDPMDHITLVTCRDGNTVVNADCPGNPNDWREIRSAASVKS